MVDSGTLRSLGHDALADLIRLRPELLPPRPPRSLKELAARLEHRVVTMMALRRLDLPTLQVAQVLAALGDRADRAGLLGLLGVAPDDDAAVAAVDRAVASLRVQLLLSDPPGLGTGYRLAPHVRAVWPRPLGLADDVGTLAVHRSMEELRGALGRLGHRTDGRKAELIERLARALRDGDRLRALLGDVPDLFREQLLAVAHGRFTLDRFAWNSRTWTTAWARPGRRDDEDPRERPIEWAMTRLLLVPDPGSYQLIMPAEVAMALRGPGWTAGFDPVPPAVGWTELAPTVVRDAALAAASTALRVLDAVLTTASHRPIPALKSGALGVRELRRLTTDVGAGTGEVRLSLRLALTLKLLGCDELGFAPTDAFDRWRSLPAATRYAQVAAAWWRSNDLPFLEPDAPWDPRALVSGTDLLRAAVLAALADRPGAEPFPVPALVQRVGWQVPLLTATVIHDVGSDPAQAVPDDTDEHLDTGAGNPAAADDRIVVGAGDRVAAQVTALLAEAAWLGLTGAGALSPAGAALAGGGDVAAALGGIGAAHRSARLQTDLTAVVLGEPHADLAATLDLMADRENRSTATVWRFSPASVRRALDTGPDADTLLQQLADLAEGAVPQPLEYLVRDVARRYGTVRGRRVACYLRSDDEPLLAELVADRKLRSLGLRRIAPTVAVGTQPWPKTLEALRAAGYAPVTEDANGVTVVARQQLHRAEGVGSEDLRAFATAGPTAVPTAVPGFDPDAVAAALLAADDHPVPALLDLGATVVEVRTSDDLFTVHRY